MVDWWAYAAGYGAVGLLGLVATYAFADRTAALLDLIIPPDKNPHVIRAERALLFPLPIVMGVLERIAYTAALLSGLGAFVGFWLGVKMLGAAAWQHTEPGTRYPFQRNLVVSLASLGYGALGALVTTWTRNPDRAYWDRAGVVVGIVIVASFMLDRLLGKMMTQAKQKHDEEMAKAKAA
jgi:hypothetical protein